MKKTIKLKTFFIGFTTCCCLFFSYNSMSQSIYYVIEGATGNGTSWPDASGDIQLLINNASAGDQIWVAAGTYKPNRPADDLNDTSNPVNRDNAFVLKAGVEIYGGFTGGETSLEERDWFTNPTILSGDFNNDDNIAGAGSTLEITENSENAHHVVISANDHTLESAVLDGFIITGANGNETSNITVNSVTISRGVGAVVVRVSSPVLRNLIVTGNFARNQGGGVVFQGIPATNPKVINSLISKNIAELFGGGGIYSFTEAPFDLINSAVVDNRVLAQNNNGPGGAIFAQGGTTNTINIVNTTIAGNYAYRAGGINMGGSITTNIDNSIVFGNSGNSFPNIYNTLGTMTFSYSLVEESGGSVGWNGSIFTPGGAAPANGGNNIDVDPEFTDASGGDYTLQETSLAVNAGSDVLYTNAGGDLDTDKDLGGNDRLVGVAIDIGAYEFDENVVIPVCVIECPEDIVPASQLTVDTDPGLCTYTHSGTAWDATATEDCSSVTYELTGDTSGTGTSLNGVVFNPGTTTVTWTATDGNNNTDTCSFEVTVEDNEDPEITCIGDQTVNTGAGECTYTHSGTGWDAAAADNCSATTVAYELTGDTSGTGTSLNGVVFNPGTTTVIWTATDGNNNTDTCSFEVIVEDDENPEITCIGDQTVNTGTGECTYTHNGTGWDALATDNCSATVAYELTGDTTGTGTSLNGAVFNPGTTTVTWTATDSNNNTDTCSFEVTVEDDENPEITCIGDQTVNASAGECTYTHNGTDWDAMATDNCTTPALTYLLTGVTTGSGTSLDGVTFNFGVTTVTWTADDGSGNMAQCSFMVNTYSTDCIPRKVIIISPDLAAQVIRISIPQDIIINSVVLRDIDGIDTGVPFVSGQMDILSLDSGVYFLTVDTNICTMNQTIVKP